MTAGSGPDIRIPVRRLSDFATRLFEAAGIPGPSGKVVAEALVAADMEGVPSHGVMLVPMYVDRIEGGSVSPKTHGRVVSDKGSAVVLDAENVLGQLTSTQAVEILADRARKHGIAAVAVRNAFHFGTAGRWALALADHGCIGVVMSNTRPLMPAPGGAEPVVGNNPIAIAMPADCGPPLVLDMAMSAGAMGKIRLAESAGARIPEGWATDAAGRPTTDPAEAIKGMLLPAAGPKGFGLAFMIDMLCGGLSSGSIGEAVSPLYGNFSQAYGCAHFFLAIDVGCFCERAEFERRVSGFAERVRSSRRAPGVDRIFAPGEPAWHTRRQNGELCPVAADTVDRLRKTAGKLGVPTDGVFSDQQ